MVPLKTLLSDEAGKGKAWCEQVKAIPCNKKKKKQAYYICLFPTFIHFSVIEEKNFYFSKNLI